MIAAGRSVSRSRSKDPAGPTSLIRASPSAQWDCAGRAKAKAERPSPSTTTGMAKFSAKSSSPSAAVPVSR